MTFSSRLLRRHLPALALALTASLGASGTAVAQTPGVSQSCAVPVLVTTTDLTYGCAQDDRGRAPQDDRGDVTRRCSAVRGTGRITARGVTCGTARTVARSRRGQATYLRSGFSCRTRARRFVRCGRSGTGQRAPAVVSFRLVRR
jgi:hypothetical protein